MTVSADSSSELFVQDGVNFKCQVMMKLKNNVHLKTIRIPGFIFSLPQADIDLVRSPEVSSCDFTQCQVETTEIVFYGLQKQFFDDL